MLKSIHRRKITPSHGSSGRNHRTKRLVKKQQGSRRVTGKIRSKSIKILERSFSEPSILYRSCFGEDDGHQREDTPKRTDLPVGDPDQIVYLSQIRSEVFASAPSLSGFSSPSSSPMNKEVKKREAEKVVISVSVEGSPGPLRTLVKLSCNVEETIKIVVKKYCEEGRTPKLDNNLAFELHQSHFSIHCLEKTEVIGEVGSRSFYMRKKELAAVMVPVRKNLPSSNLIQSFIAQKIGRIVRRTRKIWNILVCVQ